MYNYQFCFEVLVLIVCIVVLLLLLVLLETCHIEVAQPQRRIHWLVHIRLHGRLAPFFYVRVLEADNSPQNLPLSHDLPFGCRCVLRSRHP